MIVLKQIELTHRDKFWNLFQKYLHELTRYYPMEMDALGNYPYPYFDCYFAEPERTAMFIYDGEALVGFVMLNDHSCLGNSIDHAIAEFTIFPQYRKRNLGMKAVQEIFARYPGRWEIKYSMKNKGAQALWTRVTKPYAPAVSSYDGTESVLSFVVAGNDTLQTDFRVKVTTFSCKEDRKGSKTITETVRDEVVPNPDGRHDILCAKCGWSTYPRCRKTCQNEQWWRARHPKEAAEFKKWWYENHPEDTEPFPEDK